MFSGEEPFWEKGYRLGLDAPLVAVSWLYIFAETWRLVYHPWQVYIALFLIVWAFRVGGRQLTFALTQKAHLQEMLLPKRMQTIVYIAGLIGMVLIVLKFPIFVYSYLMISVGLLVLHLVLSLFSEQEPGQISYSKHVITGITFAFGVSLMAHAYLPNLGIVELLRSREFISFAVLIIITSSAVEQWIIISKKEEPVEVRVRDEVALSLPLTLLGAAALVFALQADLVTARPFFYAILTGAASLQILNRVRYRFSESQIRALVILCLLFPGVVFLAYQMSQ